MDSKPLVAMAAALLLAACSSKQAEATHPPEPGSAAGGVSLQSEATSKQVMLGLTIPASDVLWGVGSKVPADDAEWERVTANAQMLSESGLLLLSAPRDVGQAEWTQHATDLVRLGRTAAAAAQKRDVDALLAAGDEIYTVCETCHNKYMPARVAEQAAAQQ